MKKWMYVVTGVVVVAAVMAVILGVRFLALERPAVENDVPGPNGNVVDNGADSDVDNGVDDVPDVAAATSIRFSVEWTALDDEAVACTHMAKDIGTEDFKLRIDGQVDSFEAGTITVGTIINGELGQAWMFQNGEWVEIPVEYWGGYWEGAVTELDAYIAELQGWTHGDWTFAHPDYGYQIRIYDIDVGPDLDDALFEP